MRRAVTAGMQTRRTCPWRGIVLGALLLAAASTAPAQAGTVLVNAGGDLQSALNQARGGDVILLQAGATFVGNFVLPASHDDRGGAITVRTAASDARLPGDMTRVTPEAAFMLPKLRSPNGDPALRTAPGARHWRIVLVEFLPTAGGAGDIIRLGDGSSDQSELSSVPRDLVLDRCYVHGDPSAGQKRGIALNSADTRIQNCWIAEIKAVGQDSQAIGGWNGPGPFAILNNRLEAAGEVFMLGGADPAVKGLIPTDVVFSGNLVTRPLEWRGQQWQVKNLLELKNAREVRIEGNLFENNWQGAQSGYAILFTPRNQDGNAPWSTVEDVHVRYNVVRHVAAAFSILGHDSPRASGTCHGVEISNNLLYDVDGGRWGGNGDFLLIGDAPSDVTVEHNTIVQSGKIISAYGGSDSQTTPIRGLVFRFNVARHNEYGVHGSGRGIGNDTLAAYFPGAVFAKNILGGASPSLYPSDNTFVSAAAFDRLFVNAADADYHLTGATPSRRGGAAAAGADIDEVNADWRAAEAGTWVDPGRAQRDRENLPRKGRGGVDDSGTR